MKSSSQHPRHAQRRQTNGAINSVVQGSAADLMKIAMNQHPQSQAQVENHPSRMLIQVHDELVFETPASSMETESGVRSTRRCVVR